MGPLSPALHGSNFQRATGENDGFRPWRRKCPEAGNVCIVSVLGRQPGWNDARACRPRNVERITIRPPVLLLQPGVFSFGLMKNRDVGIGVRPQFEEVLERLSGFRLVACERGAATAPDKTVNRTVPTRGGSDPFRRWKG